jgi:hypothetical protein
MSVTESANGCGGSADSDDRFDAARSFPIPTLASGLPAPVAAVHLPRRNDDIPTTASIAKPVTAMTL